MCHSLHTCRHADRQTDGAHHGIGSESKHSRETRVGLATYHVRTRILSNRLWSSTYLVRWERGFGLKCCLFARVWPYLYSKCANSLVRTRTCLLPSWHENVPTRWQITDQSGWNFGSLAFRLTLSWVIAIEEPDSMRTSSEMFVNVKGILTSQGEKIDFTISGDYIELWLYKLLLSGKGQNIKNTITIEKETKIALFLLPIVHWKFNLNLSFISPQGI